jgi:DNA-binding Xre family transcriptional regulator
MEDSYLEVRVKLKKSTFNDLNAIVSYINSRDQIINHERKSSPCTIEEVIKGAIVREIDKIKTFHYDIIRKGSKKIGGKSPLKNRLKEILKELNIKQLDLSEMTGIDRSNISFIVNNRNQPSADYLFRIWVALDFYPLEEMFYREEK